MGTPEFSVPSLVALHEKYTLEAVVTVPDKPQGRGLKLIPSAVKSKASELGIKVLQPEILKDEIFIKELELIKPDIIVVIAFRILPPEVYKTAKLGAFNVHASLLPKYRGAAPINHAIINGETETGLTTFLLEQKVDTGSILLQKKIGLTSEITAGDLHDIMMKEAVTISIETCELLINGNYKTQIQDNALACPAPKIFPEQCKIDWSNDSIKVRNFIHGTSPIPGAWSLWNGKRLKIYRVKSFEDYTDHSNIMTNKESGTLILTKDKMIVKCGKGSIELMEIHYEGKKTMGAEAFLRGYRGESESKLV